MLFQSQIAIEVGLAMGISRKVVKICKVEGVVPQLKHHFLYNVYDTGICRKSKGKGNS